MVSRGWGERAEDGSVGTMVHWRGKYVTLIQRGCQSVLIVHCVSQIQEDFKHFNHKEMINVRGDRCV